jgi:hypothetical protein
MLRGVARRLLLRALRRDLGEERAHVGVAVLALTIARTTLPA